MSTVFGKIVSNEKELRDLIGYPSDLVSNKVITKLDHHCRDFIEKSPFLMISTSDAGGCCDVSPRGDGPGFVSVLDEQHLIIPERPGNKRMDSLRNILSNAKVGLIFLIPGLGETLRINGTACIIQDEARLNSMAVNGKKPWLGIGVTVEECFIHCAKAFKRSGLWNPSSWPDQTTLPSAAKILHEHAKLPNSTQEQIEARLQKAYTEKLY